MHFEVITYIEKITLFVIKYRNKYVEVDQVNKHKILLVDDDTDILNLLETTLKLNGFEDIQKAENGLIAIDMCKKFMPHIVILDIMLPDIDGYEVCKQIRLFSHCSILFLSSKNDEIDKILGLAVGGDDYVTKPFSPQEVVYRVKAQLRRLAYTQNPLQQNLIKVGKLIIDPDGGYAKKGDIEIKLTAREFKILLFLAQNIGRIISKERIYESIWGEDSFGCDNTIMVHIRHLREKLEDDPTAPKYIMTVKGLGYKMVNSHEN